MALYPHGVVVPQKAAYLAHDHGHPISGKTHVQVWVKVVYGFDEPDAPHLKQVVHAFAPAHEFLHHAQHQPQVALYHPLAGLLVACAGGPQQGGLFLLGEHRKFCGVHAAYLDLAVIQRWSRSPHGMTKVWPPAAPGKQRGRW